MQDLARIARKGPFLLHSAGFLQDLVGILQETFQELKCLPCQISCKILQQSCKRKEPFLAILARSCRTFLQDGFYWKTYRGVSSFTHELLKLIRALRSSGEKASTITNEKNTKNRSSKRENLFQL